MKRYLVTVQRPAVESTQIMVEAEDEADATEKALALASTVPDGRWFSDPSHPYKAFADEMAH